MRTRERKHPHGVSLENMKLHTTAEPTEIIGKTIYSRTARTSNAQRDRSRPCIKLMTNSMKYLEAGDGISHDTRECNTRRWSLKGKAKIGNLE